MRTLLVEVLRRYRVPVLITLDFLAWITAMFVGVGLRLETAMVEPVVLLRDAGGSIPLWGTLIVGAAAGFLHVASAAVLRLHQGRHALAGFEEMFTLASVVLVCGMVVGLANLANPYQYIPTTSVAVACVLALFLSGWPRALWRATVVHARPNRFGVVSTPVIIAGAGEAGRDLVSSMQRDPHQNWRPMAFADDDPRKRHFRHRGVAVKGTTDDLKRISDLTGADTLVVAMPSVESDVITRIYESAREIDLAVKVIPSVYEMLGQVSFADIRDIEPADLLGRRPIEIDMSAIAGYLAGRTVLVTGAGGSIGSELCRQISLHSPKRLLMLDRDESALHSLMLSIDGRADLESPDILLADIRDAERMHEIFRDCRPNVVFHAAALKHVNMLEHHPAEAVKTNVVGTRNVLQAAVDIGVERFINISTDKAADPENVLGYSKRIAEGLTTSYAALSPGTFVSVRFGNVLGTRGSVLTTFSSQIARGGPVTVTDPAVTRFFMTVNEAVQLVVQAAAIGNDGEALILDMGEPVRILDVARRMIEQSGRDIDVVITGLKPGEKLHEILIGATENDHRPSHPLVSHVEVPTLSSDELEGLIGSPTTETMIALCERMVPPAGPEIPTSGGSPYSSTGSR